MGRLDGKTAIVTGAGRGIGRAIALRFAAEGARVVVASRTEARIHDVVREIQAAGGEALGVGCDVCHEDQIQTMMSRTVAHYGAIDVLVNNAHGFGMAGKPALYPTNTPLEAITDAEWELQLRVGLMGTLWCMRSAFPYMKTSGGKIINFGSLAGQRGQAGTAPYNVSKEAIRALSRTAAREWARYRINVNVINPAAQTDALTASQNANPVRESARHTPLGRMGDPLADIAPVALFLASSDSDFVTGMTLMADGGLLIGP
jgi:NAD(P)-dependent dehydrogenase (short-subunit alcohol dehydrogenase family)